MFLISGKKPSTAVRSYKLALLPIEIFAQTHIPLNVLA